MKTIQTITIAALLTAVPVQAQWTVYDPTVHSQSVINQAEDIAKFVEMIDHQVQQINRLTSQLRELEQYNRAFGDPSKTLEITGADALVRDLKRTSVGKTIADLRKISKGVDALRNNANGLYRDVGEIFTTPSGNQVTRHPKRYRPHAAIIRSAQNFTNVFWDVQIRRRDLKAEIAATTEKLQTSETDAETQKLTGVLIGLNAALAATDEEVDQALGLALIQQVENRNDADKQANARAEEQQAELTESLQNYNDTFKLSDEPAHFPESK